VLSKKWQSLAYILRVSGKYAESAELYEKALRYQESLVGYDQRALALGINSMRRLDGGMRVWGLLFPGIRFRFLFLFRFLSSFVSACLSPGLAIVYRLQAKYDKAEPLYKKALQIRQTIFGVQHEDIAQSMNSLGAFVPSFYFLNFNRFFNFIVSHLQAV
jgi:tetratricopeptide (TPR) repeat protein